VTKDISNILDGWDFQPNEISVRKIKGRDGKLKLQMRLDLGLLQMELKGRPDGTKPFGCESYFEYYESLVEEYQKKYDSDVQFKLDTDDCLKLQQEAIQYYHRYLCCFQIEDYTRVVQDTGRNLNVLDFVKQYAVEDADIWAFEQYRPYIIMMNTRAKGMMLLARKDYDAATAVIHEGIKNIQKFFKEYDQEQMVEVNRELSFLEQWLKEVEASRPLSDLELLQRDLDLAVQHQEYENAAKIRDEIKKINSE